MVAPSVANSKTMPARHCQLQRLVGRRVPEPASEVQRGRQTRPCAPSTHGSLRAVSVQHDGVPGSAGVPELEGVVPFGPMTNHVSDGVQLLSLVLVALGEHDPAAVRVGRCRPFFLPGGSLYVKRSRDR